MNWNHIAREVAQRIATLNEKEVDLGSVFLFVDLDAGTCEITTEKDFSTLDNPTFFGSLDEIDPNALIVPSDADSLFVVDCIAEMLEDADYFDDEDEDDEEE